LLKLILIILFLGRIALLLTYVRLIVTYRVAWSVCRSVCHSSELCKNGWTDRFVVWVVDSGWPEGSTSSIVFARWRQCALMGGHTGATGRIRFYRPSAAAMRPYVKLLVIITWCYWTLFWFRF